MINRTLFSFAAELINSLSTHQEVVEFLSYYHKHITFFDLVLADEDFNSIRPKATLALGQICCINNRLNILKYWDLAAKQGDTTAMFRLGILKYKGEIIPTNYVEAFKYFEK